MEISEILGINKLLDRFRRDVSDTFDYHFKATNASDFELTFIFTAKSKVLTSIFNNVKETLAKNEKLKGVKDADPNTIQRFEIPKQFYGRVLTAILKPVHTIEREVKADGIKVLRYAVESCYFESKEEKTQIHIKLGGIYGR